MNSYKNAVCMSIKDVRHKIVVFGENHHNTLGLIRSLGEAGLHSNLILVNSNKIYPFVTKSRYVDNSWVVDNVRDGLAVILSNFDDKEYKTVIFPTFDSEVKIIGENFELLKDKYITPSIIDRDWSLVEVLNKEFMRNLAQSIGLDTPKSWVVDCTRNEGLPKDLAYPCVIKVIDSASGPKSYEIISSENDLLTSLNCLKKYCSIIQIQEFIKKKTEIILLGWSDGRGTTVIPCVMDKLREYPKDFGTTGLGKVTADINKYVCKEKVCEYINTLGYSGLFSVEFLLCDDKAYFLEVNLRNDGNGYLPTFGGVNLPYQWFLSVTDQCDKLALLPRIIASDFVMMREFTDIMIPIKYGYPFIKWISDFFKTDCFLYWNKKDKIPYFYFLMYKLFRIIRKIFKIK